MNASHSTLPWRVRSVRSGSEPRHHLTPSTLPQRTVNRGVEESPRIFRNPCAAVTPPLNTTETPSTHGTYPGDLRQKSLKCTMDGAILWAMVSELASIELMFHLVATDDIDWDQVQSEMQKWGVALPEGVDLLDICTMSPRDVHNVQKNIDAARDDLLDHLGGYFCPNENEQFCDWLEDGKGYTDGRRVEAVLHVINSSSRRDMLSDWASQSCATFVLLSTYQ